MVWGVLSINELAEMHEHILLTRSNWKLAIQAFIMVHSVVEYSVKETVGLLEWRQTKRSLSTLTFTVVTKHNYTPLAQTCFYPYNRINYIFQKALTRPSLYSWNAYDILPHSFQISWFCLYSSGLSRNRLKCHSDKIASSW